MDFKLSQILRIDDLKKQRHISRLVWAQSRQKVIDDNQYRCYMQRTKARKCAFNAADRLDGQVPCEVSSRQTNAPMGPNLNESIYGQGATQTYSDIFCTQSSSKM